MLIYFMMRIKPYKENNMTKDQMLERLRNGRCAVQFTKKDGSVRNMLATLNFDFIPEEKQPKGTGKAQPDNSPIIRAFDLDKEEFRSINTDTVTVFTSEGVINAA